MAIHTTVNETASNGVSSRLTGAYRSFSDTNAAESGPISELAWDYMEGYRNGAGSNANEFSWMWRRAPGFMDVVIPNSTSYQPALNTHHHNLGVAPELIIAKCRDFDQRWYVGIQGDLTGDSYHELALNTDAASNTGNVNFTWGNHTDETFYSTLFGTPEGYVHYLFASVPGICDIGSFTDTGSEADIDCGFSNGARFVLIKPTDSSGSWSFFDTARGISNSSSPRLALNKTDAQQGGTSIKPYSGGFRIALGTTITYIYMAIA
jgi:hypothetical protein